MPRGAKPIPGPLSRVIGSILRARQTRLDVPTERIAAALGISDGQVSRLLRAARQMDIEQLHAICELLGLDIRDVINEAVVELGKAPARPSLSQPEGAAARRASAEVTASRARAAIGKLLPGGPSASAPLLLPALSAVGEPMSSENWREFLAGSRSFSLDDRAVEAIAAALGLRSSYFTTADPAEIERGEADIELRVAMEETGVTRIAARSVDQLPTDAIRAVTEMIRSTKTES